MRKFTTRIIALAAIIFLYAGCYKNNLDYNPNPIPLPFDPGTTITTGVAGTILDQDGKALNNVKISIGDSKVYSDVNGDFFIPKAVLAQKAGLVLATKDGYFKGTRTITAKEKVINNVVIQLIKKAESGNFTNTIGGNITVTGGGNIQFPADAVVTAGGAAYSGSVKVSAYFLDPTKDESHRIMPGDLRGVTTTGKEQVLTSYGMMAVELNGTNGETLQLASGKTATLTMPIPTLAQASAPATIPLWYFDEVKGMWIEQGSAVKTGNNYIGTVSHFTWWNCDWGGGPINYTITCLDVNGEPIQGVHVWMLPEDQSYGGGHGYTASDGSLTGCVPAGKPIKIRMYIINTCDYTEILITSYTTPAFNSNTDEGTKTLLITQDMAPFPVTIKGIATDCNNTYLKDGYVSIELENKYYRTQITNGTFVNSFIRCDNGASKTATITVVDNSNLQQNATTKTLNVTTGNFNVGEITACGLQKNIRYTAKIVDQNGNPLQIMYVNFGPDSITTTYASQGNISAIIPANKSVTRAIYVYNTIPSCAGYRMVDSVVIGPYASNFNAGTIVINVPEPVTVTVSGTVNDCNNAPVNGRAQINLDGYNHTAIILNGSFSLPIDRCVNTTTTATINVIDDKAHTQNSTPITPTVSSGSVNIGTIQACGLDINTYLDYTIGTDPTKTISDSSTYYSSGYTFLGAYSYDYLSFTNFKGVFFGYSTGAYNMTVKITEQGGGVYKYYTADTITVNITEYGEQGGFITGTFSGTVISNNNSPGIFPITGSFRLKRLI